MKYTHIIWVALVVGCCWACSEDNLTPSEPYHNFGANANATDEESILRRNFFEANGFYIIFNDTISKEYIGTGNDGEPLYKTETVDPAWSFYDKDTYTDYEFSYCNTMEEKKKGADFVSGLAKIIEKHNLTRPYSVMVVNGITTKQEDDYYDKIIISHPGFINSLRCFIIALPENAEDKDQQYLFAANMAGNGLALKYEGELAAFYAQADSKWGSLYGDLNWGESLEEYYEMGFLFITSDEYYPTKGEDVAAYLYLLMTKSEEEVHAEFAEDYPKVWTKYLLMRNIAEKAGLKF